MPQVIITEGAVLGMERCRRFLETKSPDSAIKAGEVIARQLLLLETAPELGRPFTDIPELRELVIAFGNTGYVALYRHEVAENAVYVLAFRHQRECGY